MKPSRPNILFIMSDDHAAHAMSCYSSRINETPHIDRIALQGMRFDNCFCTNSLCAPSRASIMTGNYSHVNGVRILSDKLDPAADTFAKQLQAAGYQTALVGKWHLYTEPQGFDYYKMLPGQGLYHDPFFIESGSGFDWEGIVNQHDETMGRQEKGYVTDLIADACIDWLDRRVVEKPFMLMCHHKAPHRPWEPDDKHKDMYADIDIPEPGTLYDDYENRASAARDAKMRVGEHMNKGDVKQDIPEGLSVNELRTWAYQYYIKDYLRCVAAIDDNVGRLLDYLDENGLTENTLVIYTSDQGFFLGDHGWYDKRFMYEESLRMPFVVRYPEEIEPGTVNGDIVLNIDFPALFMDLAGLETPGEWQGRSFRPLLRGEKPADWRNGMYYRYWEHGGHGVYAHYGLRTLKYKLIYYYADPLDTRSGSIEVKEPEWELFDLENDPCEMKNVYSYPDYANAVTALKKELHRVQAEVGDERYYKDI